MKVIDLFCGAGGFSEGFRQAGFEIIWAVDKWKPAVLTHQKNHPTSNTIIGDVEKIAFLSDAEFEETVPDSEIIIGSPPCIEFSNSNRSGKADKAKGVRLIESFLRIVARKKFKNNSKLKYWLLENVPNAQTYVKDEYRLCDLNLDGDGLLKTRNNSQCIFYTQYYGVPSKRKRFICGEFPLPERVITTEEEVIPLFIIQKSLGEPFEELKIIADPNYEFLLHSTNLTDHHYIQELADFQWKKAKRLKQDKGYMGKMSFPENVNKPARTVMATMSLSARESMIFANKNKEGSYRAPTIREVATLMSFPLDYRFYGDSISLKYQLVGNSVPPKFSNSLANAIARKENINVKNEYIPLVFPEKDNEFNNLNAKDIPVRKEKPKRNIAKYKYHIPYLIIDTFRVELTNYHSDFMNRNFQWNIEIHKSQGPKARVYRPYISPDILSQEELFAIEKATLKINNRLTKFNEFQQIYCLPESERNASGLIGPDELLDYVKKAVILISEPDQLSSPVDIGQEPGFLPKAIVIGYILLNSIIKTMEGF